MFRLMRFLLCMLCLLNAVAADDLPATTARQLESSRKAHAEKLDIARAKLQEAFDVQKKKIGMAGGIEVENRIEVLEGLDAGEAGFKESGRLPFSPLMRLAGIEFIKTVAQSERILKQNLEKAGSAALKQGDAELARKLEAERSQVSFCVSSWDCSLKEPNGRIRKWRWDLYSDFTVNPNADQENAYPKSWSFGRDSSRIIIVNVAVGAPKGGFKDTCTIHFSGRRFEARNQLGATYTGVRVD